MTWHLTSTASPEHPLFDFDYGFFELEIHTLSTFDPTVFGLELGGALGLAVAGLEGRVGYSEFRLAMPDAQHPSPVRQWPQFSGGRFTLMGITSLELGTFEVGEATTLQLTQGSDPENIETVEIPVQSYLRFANSQGSAVRISLGDALAGGVEEVLVYRDTGGTLFLYVKNAALDLAGVGRLNASMRYLQGPAGFSLLMAGGGTLEGLGSIAAAGKFAVLNDRLSMGVFIAVRTETAIPLIPQAPPVLGLTGVGGGIFLRPEAADLEAVQDAVAAMDPALGFMLEQRGLPPTDAGFAVMAYASFVMLGQGPINVKEVHLSGIDGSVYQPDRQRQLPEAAAETGGRLFGHADLGAAVAHRRPHCRTGPLCAGLLRCRRSGIFGGHPGAGPTGCLGYRW